MKDKTYTTFEDWFSAVVSLAGERGTPTLIDKSNPTAYMEYFDDGDCPEDCVDMEEANAEDLSYGEDED